MKKFQLVAIILFILVIINPVGGTTDSLRFQPFALNKKLPTGSVYRIFNDSEGYFWLGTTDGLCRFDGYELKVFRSSSVSLGVLKNNDIQCISEDKLKNIWVGMREGINIIDKRKYQIKSFDSPYTNKDRINSILSSKDGFIWIATSHNGIIRVNPETLYLERYSNDNSSKLSLKSNSIIQLYEDKEGRIWFTLWNNGFGYISKDRKKIVYGPIVGSANNPYRVYQEKNGNFLLCSWGDGVYKFKVENNEVVSLTPIEIVASSQFTKINRFVYSITQDDKWGHIWLISNDGLHILQKRTDGKYIILKKEQFISPDDPIYFYDIYKDKSGTLWLGSISDGAFFMEFKTNKVHHRSLKELTNKNLNKINVNKIVKNEKGQIILFIFRLGLFNYDLLTGKISPISLELDTKFTNNLSVLFPRRSDEMWVAKEGENFIRIFKQRSTSKFTYEGNLALSPLNELKENTITQLFQDSKMNIWIGSYDGLYMRTARGELIHVSRIKSANSFSEDSNHNVYVGTDSEGAYKFIQVKGKQNPQFKEEKLVLVTNDYEISNIRNIICTKDGRVYIGSKEGCIFVLETNGKILEISWLYGITEDNIQDFSEDESGSLWITTTKRIIKYNPKTHTSIYFTNADGINMTYLNKGTALLTEEGNMLVGGNNGICNINAKNIVDGNYSHNNHVYITDLFVENKSVFTTKMNEMYNANKNRITANYRDNNIRIDFSTLNYSSITKIQYAYKLQGIDNDWVYTGNDSRNVNYTNLSPGNYIFMVKSSNENGKWSDDITSIEIKILPPFYRSWWAYLTYALLIVISIFVSIKVITDRIKLKSELSISVINKEKSEELNRMKLKYFTNISHELLTPLTIIMLQIESLQKKFKYEISSFETMKENVTRLKRLIKQILVFRKTESGHSKLNVIENDVIAFLKKVCETNFRPLIIENEIDFRIDFEYDHYMAYFDPDNLDIIIYNLLSNAFKYTPKQGTIAVKISFRPLNEITMMRLSVADSGTGISEEDLPKIFERFYISNSSDQSQSHGIGLSLTQELVSQHKGTIQVRSQLSEGSVFTIEIPISKNAYTNEELSEEDEINITTTLVNDSFDDVTKKQIESDERISILIVEDNRDLNKMIVKRFSEEYTVFSAANGIEAINVLKNNEIDLVISDVMMPDMDGITLCKVIKNDLNICHIGVILLTAKNSTEDRINCYNAGGDAYISKPFEMSVLYSRVQNLIVKSKKKTENFQHNHLINISAMEYNSIDELFLKKAISAIEENIAVESFNFDLFAMHMMTSKPTLHRKIKSLTGLSPVEFIRNIRMKHAIQMLDNNVGNISEIAYAVGFGDPKYFSKCFKVQFGSTPSEYLKQKGGNDAKNSW